MKGRNKHKERTSREEERVEERWKVEANKKVKEGWRKEVNV